MGNPQIPNDGSAAPVLRVVTNRPESNRRRRSRSQKRVASYRERWIYEVGRSPHITDSVRAFLLVLAHHHMDEDGYSEVKQEVMADLLSKPIRRVYDRYQAAIGVGLLVEVSRGGAGVGITYRAEIPHNSGRLKMRNTRPSNL